MEKIYKYILAVTDEQVIYLPQGATLLTVQVQHGVPCLWAKVNPDSPNEEHRIIIKGTGHSLEEVGEYLGTFQLYSGELVFHAFEALSPTGKQGE